MFHLTLAHTQDDLVSELYFIVMAFRNITTACDESRRKLVSTWIDHAGRRKALANGKSENTRLVVQPPQGVASCHQATRMPILARQPTNFHCKKQPTAYLRASMRTFESGDSGSESQQYLCLTNGILLLLVDTWLLVLYVKGFAILRLRRIYHGYIILQRWKSMTTSWKWDFYSWFHLTCGLRTTIT